MDMLTKMRQKTACRAVEFVKSGHRLGLCFILTEIRP